MTGTMIMIYLTVRYCMYILYVAKNWHVPRSHILYLCMCMLSAEARKVKP